MKRPLHRAGYVAVAAGLLLTGAWNGAAAGPGEPSVSAWPVAQGSPDGTSDLNRDGIADVIVGGPRKVLAFRRGQDGGLLWSLTGKDTGTAYAMRLGNPARPGVLIMSTAGMRAGKVLTMTAYDGPTGQFLWDWSATDGTVEALIPGPKDRAARILVRISQPQSNVESLIMVSGSTGASASFVARHFKSQTKVLGDLDGDGYADIGLLDANRFAVFSSSSGKRLWNRLHVDGEIPEYYIPVADVSGDHVSDVVLNSWFGGPAASSGRAYLLDGKTGAEIWSVLDMSLAPIGDATGDGRTDFVGVTLGSPCGTRVVGYNGANGSPLWQRVLAPSSTSCYVYAYPAGDVQPDGTSDVLVHLDTNANVHVDELLDGRTGNWIWQHPVTNHSPSIRPVYDSIDGQGDDFACVMNADPGDCQPITVLDGRTHTVDFAFDPASSKYNVMSFADFGQFSSDKRADILLTSREDYYTGEIAVTVVDGATHQIRWSITPT